MVKDVCLSAELLRLVWEILRELICIPQECIHCNLFSHVSHIVKGLSRWEGRGRSLVVPCYYVGFTCGFNIFCLPSWIVFVPVTSVIATWLIGYAFGLPTAFCLCLNCCLFYSFIMFLLMVLTLLCCFFGRRLYSLFNLMTLPQMRCIGTNGLSFSFVLSLVFYYVLLCHLVWALHDVVPECLFQLGWILYFARLSLEVFNPLVDYLYPVCLSAEVLVIYLPQFELPARLPFTDLEFRVLLVKCFPSCLVFRVCQQVGSVGHFDCLVLHVIHLAYIDKVLQIRLPRALDFALQAFASLLCCGWKLYLKNIYCAEIHHMKAIVPNAP